MFEGGSHRPRDAREERPGVDPDRARRHAVLLLRGGATGREAHARAGALGRPEVPPRSHARRRCDAFGCAARPGGLNAALTGPCAVDQMQGALELFRAIKASATATAQRGDSCSRVPRTSSRGTSGSQGTSRSGPSAGSSARRHPGARCPPSRAGGRGPRGRPAPRGRSPDTRGSSGSPRACRTGSRSAIRTPAGRVPADPELSERRDGAMLDTLARGRPQRRVGMEGRNCTCPTFLDTFNHDHDLVLSGCAVVSSPAEVPGVADKPRSS